MLAGKLMTAIFSMVILCLSLTGVWAVHVKPIIDEGLLEDQLGPLIGEWNEKDTPPTLRVVRIVLDDFYAADLLDLPKAPARGEWFKRLLGSLTHDSGKLQETLLVETLRRDPGTIGMSLDGYRHHGRKEAVAELRRTIQKAQAAGGRIQIVVQGYLTDTVMQAISGEDNPQIDRILVLGVNDWAYAHIAKGRPKEFVRPENVSEVALMWLRKETIPRSMPIQLYDENNKGFVLHGTTIFPALDLNTFHGRKYATYQESLKAISDILYTMTDPAYPLAKILGRKPDKPFTIELPSEEIKPDLLSDKSAKKKPSALADKPEEEKDPSKIDYSGPYNSDKPFTMAAPAGWSYEIDRKHFGRSMGAGRFYFWDKRVFINSTLQTAAGNFPRKTGPWAEIMVEYQSFGRLAEDDYASRRKCSPIKVKNVTDFAMELNCGSKQSCRPCKKRKCPRSPVFHTCGDFLSEIELPLGTGYLFKLEPEAEGVRSSAPSEFSKNNDTLLLLYDIPKSPGIHKIIFRTPKKYYDRYSPAFQAVVDSYRLHPR